MNNTYPNILNMLSYCYIFYMVLVFIKNLWWLCLKRNTWVKHWEAVVQERQGTKARGLCQLVPAAEAIWENHHHHSHWSLFNHSLYPTIFTYISSTAPLTTFTLLAPPTPSAATWPCASGATDLGEHSWCCGPRQARDQRQRFGPIGGC